MWMKTSGPFICYVFFIFISGCAYDKVTPFKPVTGCDTVSVTYSQTIKPILIANCYACHTDTSSLKMIDIYFNDFSVLKKYATEKSDAFPTYSVIEARIRHLETPGMPYKRPKLSDCDIKKIEIWIRQGAPEN
jgi:hypothetical protein